MAFATRIATSSGHTETNATVSHPVNIPDGSNVAGRRILAFFTSDGAGESDTFPAGWTKIVDNQSIDFLTQSVAYYDTTGLEGYPATGAIIDVAESSGEQSAHFCYLLGGFHTSTAPAVSAGATATSNAPNSDSLDPAGWATEDTLWISHCSCDVAPAITGYPSGYSGGTAVTSPGSAGVTIGVAYKEAASASEDPGSFTIDASRAWRAVTIAIRPAAAVASAIPVMMNLYRQRR